MRNRYKLARRIILALILLALILAGFFYYLKATYSTTIERNANYIADSATQTAKRVDDLLISAENSITAIAEMYGRSADPGAADVEILNELTESTVFDYIGMVDASGVYTDNSGRQADVSDREYFREGLRGNSGMDMIFNGRVSGEDLVIFYAPLRKDGKVVGVLTGRYRQEQMRSILASEYFGEPANTYLCLDDGTVIASSKAKKPGNILDTLNSNNDADQSAVDTLAEALKTGSSASLTYENSRGSSTAYVTKLPHCDWMLLKVFPIEVTGKMLSESRTAATGLLIWLVFLATVYIVILLAESYRDKRKLTSEKQQMRDIVESASMLFSRFILADLEHDTYTIFTNEDFDDDSALPEKGAYSELCRLWHDRIIEEEAGNDRPDPFSRESLREHLTEETPYLQYEDRVMEDGSVHWKQASILCLKREKGAAASVLIAVQDVTELKEMELRSRSAMENAYHSAQAANNAKRRFLFDMSHDMRTPMNALIGLSDLLERDAGDPEKVRSYSRKISTSGRQLLSLINEVLDMSKIESGSTTLELSPFALSDLLEDTDAVFAPQAQEKGQQLEITCHDVVQDCLIGDKLRLSEILHNLLSNAITYTPEGGKVSLTVRGLEQITPGFDHILFEVTDNGMGMSPDFARRIFEPFTREQNSTASGIQGAGLGMTITKSLVDLMGGTITVDSAQDLGTTVRVELELRTAEGAEDKENDSKQPASEEPALKGLRLLVAEDNEINAEIIMELLGIEGVECEHAADGREAVATLQERPAGYYDAVMMDIQMPVMDGYEAAEAIRQLPDRQDAETIPIIAMTANAFTDDVQKSMEAGMNAHLSKPIVIEEVVSVIRKLVGRL